MLSLVALAASAQNITVKGTITDASTGEAVPSAAVQVKGTTTGAIADLDGNFTISAPADGTLVFSSIGYITVETPVKGKSTFHVLLDPDAKMLDETIVVAFGTATRESFTGSATVVKSDDIAKVQNSNPTRALEGMVAGVQMTTASGSLSASPSIQIRGISSISAGTAPLYVVDGIPYDGDLNNINSADIESMTVLKDAASNALYGARGANGVIMITTKKARSRDAVVTLDARVGVNSKALQSYDYITNPAQYYELHYAALYNSYLNAGQSPSAAWLRAANNVAGPASEGGLAYNVYTVPQGELLIGSNGKLNPNATLGRTVNFDGVDFYLTPDNWMNEAYRTSVRQEYNASVSGATDKASFYASFGYLNNNGIIAGENMTRYSARLRADYQAKKWLKVGANMSYAHYEWNNGNDDEGSSGSTANIFAFASQMAPIYPLYMRTIDAEGNISKMIDEHGLTRLDYGGGLNAGLHRPIQPNANALQAATLDIGNTVGNAFSLTGFAEAKFAKYFTFTFNAGLNLDEYRGTSIANMWYGQFVPDGGTIQKSHGRSFQYNLQQILSYDRTFADIHHINVMVGHENYASRGESLSAYKKRLFSMGVRELNGAVVDGQGASSSASDYNNEGVFFRAQYDWAEKLFVSASYRADASSRFHPDNRWGHFWSAGIGWLMNKENWFTASWVDMLKLKASVGSQGNDNIGSFRYTDTYVIKNNEGQIAINFNSKGNKNISWETNTNFNVGADFDLFKGRLSGSIEYFYRLTSDMLFFFNVPASLGYSGYYDNIGDMSNSGIELSLNVTPVRTRTVEWNLYANGTHYKNKIVRLPDERKTKEQEGYFGYASGNKFVGEGLPLNTFLLAKYAGVDQQDGLPMWYKDVYQLDAEGNPATDEQGRKIVLETVTTKSYSESTQYLCNNVTPKFYGGFGTSLRVGTPQIGDFDFNASFTYSLGGLTYDSGYASLMTNPGNSVGSNYHKDLLSAWTPENPSATIPRFAYKDQNIAAASDRFLTDASYLNFQNLQVGYQFPSRLTQRAKIGKIRIYCSIDNICYFSYRHGLDPRQSFSGATGDSYASPMRTVSGGLNITF